MTRCKDDCEALISSVLPVAEQMLLEHGTICAFGSTLSADGQIARVGGWSESRSAHQPELIAEFETAFRDGAARGELIATALLESVSMIPPGKVAAEQAVSIRLDHRDDYSVVLAFPYRFSAAGELQIDEPFAAAGNGGIFR
jgi:hypothetical protein